MRMVLRKADRRPYRSDQNRLSDDKTGKHRATEYSVFAAFAAGLRLPPAARQALDLDGSSPTAGIGVPQPRPAPFAEISLEYPDTPTQAAGNVASLWQADLADQGGLLQGASRHAITVTDEGAGPGRRTREEGVRVSPGRKARS
jgi:hypothetical protein